MREFTSDEVFTLLTPQRSVQALADALRQGIDVEDDSPRLFSGMPEAEFLMMPSFIAASGERRVAAGVKVLTIAPGNPAIGLPKIQGTYLLFDGETLAPVATIDGAALTLVRTPAVTSLAIVGLHGASAIEHLLVYGSGPQALAHVRFLAALGDVDRVSIAGRTPDRATQTIEALRADGFDVDHADGDAVARADVIVCASSATTPLFDGARVRDDAVVAAIGTHGRENREVDEALVLRSDIVVEARASALRESGNLLLAADGAHWQAHPPLNLSDLVNEGPRRRPGHPALYSAVGMAWEDLVLAQALVEGESA